MMNVRSQFVERITFKLFKMYFGLPFVTELGLKPKARRTAKINLSKRTFISCHSNVG